MEVLTKPIWKKHPQWGKWIKGLLNNKNSYLDPYIPHSILADPENQDHPELRRKLLLKKGKRNRMPDKELNELIALEHWRSHPYFQEKLQGLPYSLENLRKVLGRGKLMTLLLRKFTTQSHTHSLTQAVLPCPKEGQSP